MKGNNQVTRISAPAFGLRATLVIVGVSIASVLTAFVAGCGDDSTPSATAELQSPETQTAVVTSSGRTVEARPAMAIAPPAASSEASTRVISLGDSLPPEISVTVEDSVVHAGGVVEITALASDDVSQVGLSDGLGRMQLFTHDPESNVWHVLYRVPLKSKDKLALSVTALNDVSRWRRVWVFLEPTPVETNPKTDGVVSK